MCDDREKLIAYLYDESNADDRRLVDEHLTSCETCREELRGLRAVRQDLLSWAVPEHESVWKAFVAPQPPVWWRQVPAWGLAAAATLVFGIGLAGGFAARTLAAAPVVAAVPPQSVAPQIVSATPEQVRALEERLASIERAALNRSEPARARDVALTRAEIELIIKDSEGRINQKTAQKLYRQAVDIANQHELDRMWVTQQINAAQDRTNSNLAKVASRGAEKEKEQ